MSKTDLATNNVDVCLLFSFSPPTRPFPEAAISSLAAKPPADFATSQRGSSGGLSQEDLDFVADALLALCEIDAAAPAYTEAIFRLKLRQARTREPLLARSLAGFSPDPLSYDEVERLVARACLTPHQYECVGLRLDGFTFADASALTGKSKQSVRSAFIAALGKLRRAWRDDPYAGLAQVYRAETSRGRSG